MEDSYKEAEREAEVSICLWKDGGENDGSGGEGAINGLSLSIGTDIPWMKLLPNVGILGFEIVLCINLEAAGPGDVFRVCGGCLTVIGKEIENPTTSDKTIAEQLKTFFFDWKKPGPDLPPANKDLSPSAKFAEFINGRVWTVELWATNLYFERIQNWKRGSEKRQFFESGWPWTKNSSKLAQLKKSMHHALLAKYAPPPPNIIL